MDIGSRIKRIRENMGMTQKELAEATGLSEISIRKYEGNDRNPKYENLEKIARGLKVSIYELNNTNSFSYALISELVDKLDKDNIFNLENLEKNTGIDKNLLHDIIKNPSKDLSISDQECLLNYLCKINENKCKDFCKDNFFYADKDQTSLMSKILYPNDLSNKPIVVSSQDQINRDAFYEIMKIRILDISKRYDMNVKESEISDIINQVDNIIYFELFKKHNNDSKFNDKTLNTNR